MYFTDDEKMKLNHFATDVGGSNLEYLADLAFKYFSREAVLAEGDAILRHQGAARFAEVLKRLPKGLRDNGNAANS